MDWAGLQSGLWDYRVVWGWTKEWTWVNYSVDWDGLQSGLGWTIERIGVDYRVALWWITEWIGVDYRVD